VGVAWDLGGDASNYFCCDACTVERQQLIQAVG
jgi:hypothetical protein